MLLLLSTSMSVFITLSIVYLAMRFRHVPHIPITPSAADNHANVTPSAPPITPCEEQAPQTSHVPATAAVPAAVGLELPVDFNCPTGNYQTVPLYINTRNKPIFVHSSPSCCARSESGRRNTVMYYSCKTCGLPDVSLH